MISVIVPCYNVEKEIDICIDSLLKQTYSDFELILIDDGSKDNTLRILYEYKVKDSRIKVISQKNSGPSVARNKGIEIASGDYIAFCDSDDYVGEQYLQHLYEKTMDECDIVIAGFNYVSVDGVVTKMHALDFSCDDKTYFEKYYATSISNRLIFGPINKLFKRKLLIEKGIRFDTKIKIREDGLFVFDYLKHCKTFQGVNATEYYYVQHEVNSTLISKLNDDEQFINARFFKIMKSLKKELSREDVVSICMMYLNMDIALINKYLSIGEISYLDKYLFIKNIHRDETFREARRLLMRNSFKKSLRYYCPPIIEIVVKGYSK